MKRISIFALCFLLAGAATIFADVKYESETVLNMEGAVGKMMKVFGAARPVKTVDYYKGDIKRSDSFDKKGKLKTTQIVNLDKELFISIDHKKKHYTQMTFDEWRQMIESTMQQIGQSSDETTQQNEQPDAEVDWDFKVDVQKTGEKETIAGKPCEKVVLTMDMDAKVTATNSEEGQAPDSASGGMAVTSTQWLYKGDSSAKKEMADFNMKFATKLGMMPGKANLKNMMAQVVQSNSRLGDAIEKLQEEGKKMNGMPMRVHTVYETTVDPETAKKMNEAKAQQDKDEDMKLTTSVGGLLGGFGKKMMKKKMHKEEPVKERNALMHSDMNVLSLATTPLARSLFDIPAGYKMVKREDQ